MGPTESVVIAKCRYRNDVIQRFILHGQRERKKRENLLPIKVEFWLTSAEWAAELQNGTSFHPISCSRSVIYSYIQIKFIDSFHYS